MLLVALGGHQVRRGIKTGISAVKGINIKVFPYSSMRRGAIGD